MRQGVLPTQSPPEVGMNNEHTPTPRESSGAGEAEGPRTPSGAGLRSTLIIGGLVVALVVGGVAAAVVFGGGDDESAAAGLEPQVAPDHVAPLPDTELGGFGDAPPVRPAEYGEPLILNFWATWCAPCREEMPHLQEYSELYGDQAAVLGVDVQDAPSNAAEFVDELGITYELAVDQDGAYFQETESVHMPTTLFVDAAGDIVYRHAGYMSYDELLGLASEHLGVQAQ